MAGFLNQRLKDFFDMRPFKRTRGMFFLSVSMIKFGQISDSIKAAKFGRQ